MSKKLLLDFEEEISYSFIGISSNLKDYRLNFYLNKLSGFDFKRTDSFLFNFNKQQFQYSLYLYLDHANMRNYYLISNKVNSVRLVKDFIVFDYILIMDGEIEEDYVKELATRIKTLPGVMLTSVLDSEIFDKIPNLRNEFDLHLDSVLKQL
jgi:hypothetical protein